MSSGNLIGANPFADSDISRDSGDDATLTVGRSASLTLGTGVLIVLGKLSMHFPPSVGLLNS